MTDQKAPEQIGQEQAEQAKGVTAEGIAKDLKQEFLGYRMVEGGHWPESEFMAVEQALVEGKIDVIEGSKLYQEREKIRDTTLSPENVQAVLKLQEALKGDTDLVKTIAKGLYAFQRERLGALNVSTALTNEAIAHEQAVDELLDIDEQPVAKLIATVHDISKYTARDTGKVDEGGKKIYEDNKVHLGLHETASAVLAGDVLEKVLTLPEVKKRLVSKLGVDDARWAKIVESWRAIADVTVANHGHREFPDKMAVPVPGQEEKKIKKLFGRQLYLDNYREVKDIIKGEVSEAEFTQIAQIIEGVREADMMVGMDPVSFSKYTSEADPTVMLTSEAKPNSYGFFLGFASSMVEYWRPGEAPDVLHLRDKKDAARDRGAVLFSILKAVETGGEAYDSVNDMCGQAFGKEGGERMVKAAKMMKFYFDDAKRKMGTPGETAESKAMFHKAFSEEVSNLLGALYSTEAGDFKQPTAQELIVPMRDELETMNFTDPFGILAQKQAANG